MGKKTEKDGGGATGKIVETTTRTREVLPDTGGELELEPTAEMDADDDALGKLYELEPGAGARYEVRRTSPSEFAGYVGTYSKEELTPENIAADWGGGRFNVRVRNARGQMLGSAPLVIAGKPKHKADPVQLPATVTPAPAAPPVDTAGIVTAVTNSMKPTIDMLSRLVEALITKPAAPPPPAGPDILTVLEKAKTIFGKGEDGGGMKALIQGIELGQKLAGDGGGSESNMADVFLEGFKTIKTAAAASASAAARQPARIAAPQAATATPGVTPAPVAAPPPPTTEQRQGQWLKAQIAFLLKQAKAGKNASLYAELFADQLPPYLPAEVVVTHMDDEGAVEQLALLVPEIAEHATWFEEFRKEALKFLPGAAGGDAGGAVIDAGEDIPGSEGGGESGGEGF